MNKSVLLLWSTVWGCSDAHQTVPAVTAGQSAWCDGWPVCPSSTPPPPDRPHTGQTLRERERPSPQHGLQHLDQYSCAEAALTQSGQELMAARKSPELHADGHLDGCEREILLLLSRLKLHQNLMELWKMRKILMMSSTKKGLFYFYLH